MPSWKRVIVSGSDASLNSLNVTTNVLAQSFTGSLFGTSSWSQNSLTASFVTSSNVRGPLGNNSVLSASFALTASHAINITVSGSINGVDYIDFDTTMSYTNVTGRLGWDSGEHTLQLGLDGGVVQYSLGEQLYQYCYNAESTTLTKGEIVYVSGSQGNQISVKRANNSGDDSSAGTLGFVAETIISGGSGWILTEGVLRKLNTNGLTAGGLLYLGATPGTYTQTPPVAPSHSVRLGYVERVNSTVGSIYVKIDNGYEIGELHDVVDNTTTTTHGDLLIKSGSVWRNAKQLTGSYGLTGSLTATQGFTGSLFGTASNVQGGAANYIPLWNTNSTLSSSVMYQSVSNIGIGTTSPQQKLVVSNAGSEGLEFVPALSSNSNLIQSYNRGTSAYNTLVTRASDYNLQVGTTSVIFVSASGNVGIGTTSPIQRLHVVGNGYFTGFAYGDSYAAFTEYRIRNAEDNKLYINGGNLQLNALTNLVLSTSSSFTERVRITIAGDVGIGGISPLARLHVSASTGGVLEVDGAGTAGSNALYVSASGNVGIGTSSPGAKLQINTSTNKYIQILDAAHSTYANQGIAIVYSRPSDGANAIAATFVADNESLIHAARGYISLATGDLIKYPNTTERMRVTATGDVGIGTTSPNARLDVSGSAIVSGSFTVAPSNAVELQVLNTGVRIGNIITDSHTVTGSLNISGNVIIVGSGSATPIFSVLGSQGELFSITDSLSGSLFSVNDISGLPILEVFSDDSVVIGDSVAPFLNTTKRISITGSTTIYSMPTASYDALFTEYVIRSGSNSRMGQFMSMWSGSSTIHSDVSTVDFGNTSGVTFTTIISGSNMVMTGSATSGTWTGKFIIRTI